MNDEWKRDNLKPSINRELRIHVPRPPIQSSHNVLRAPETVMLQDMHRDLGVITEAADDINWGFVTEKGRSHDLYVN